MSEFPPYTHVPTTRFSALLDPSYVTDATQMPIGVCSPRANIVGYRMRLHESRAGFPIIREQKRAPANTRGSAAAPVNH